MHQTKFCTRVPAALPLRQRRETDGAKIGIGGCLILYGLLTVLSVLNAAELKAQDQVRRSLQLRTIDDSRVGSAQPDSSAAADIDGDREPEVLTSMQDRDGHPVVLLYDRRSDGWNRTRIGVVEEHKEEIEWVAIGRPYPGDARFCVAVSVQHKKNGLRVFRLKEQGLSPFNPRNWRQSVANEFAGQGLRFHDLDGDHAEELVYATQGGTELGVLKYDPSAENNWRDHVIDSGNNRAWWWLDGKFYDLNGNGFHHDFFVTTRKYGGQDVGIWSVVQAKPNDLSSYTVDKIFEGNALQIDTGYVFSANRDRTPDVVMVNKPDNNVYLLDGRNQFDVTKIPIDGSAWNVKILPFLGPDHGRDSFVVAAAESPSLFWSFRWHDGAYEVRPETEHKGNYGHPLDGTFTIADLDRDGEMECITPDSASSPKSTGLGFLDAGPASPAYRNQEPVRSFKLD